MKLSTILLFLFAVLIAVSCGQVDKVKTNNRSEAGVSDQSEEEGFDLKKKKKRTFQMGDWECHKVDGSIENIGYMNFKQATELCADGTVKKKQGQNVRKTKRTFYIWNFIPTNPMMVEYYNSTFINPFNSIDITVEFGDVDEDLKLVSSQAGKEITKKNFITQSKMISLLGGPGNSSGRPLFNNLSKEANCNEGRTFTADFSKKPNGTTFGNLNVTVFYHCKKIEVEEEEDSSQCDAATETTVRISNNGEAAYYCVPDYN